jgi:hypothetical protein
MESHERLIAKLDRLGAEAGIKEMTSEIYRFSQLLNDEKMKQWDEWKAKREWVGLTDEEIKQACYEVFSYDPYVIAKAIEAKLKEKNT